MRTIGAVLLASSLIASSAFAATDTSAPLTPGKPAGVSTVRELVAAAKRTPGELKFGSTGAGTGTHLGIVKLHLAAGIKVVDVPPGPTDAIADVLGATIEGRTTYMMAPISITLTPIRDGKLFPLGVTTARRSALLSEVPTIAEAGVAGFDFPIWYGIWAPAGTPAAVVEKLSRDIARVIAGRVFVRLGQHPAHVEQQRRPARRACRNDLEHEQRDEQALGGFRPKLACTLFDLRECAI